MSILSRIFLSVQFAKTILEKKMVLEIMEVFFISENWHVFEQNAMKTA